MKKMAPTNDPRSNCCSKSAFLKLNHVFEEVCVPTNDDSSPVDENETILRFISDMLMDEEDDLENQPLTLHASLALQATQKSLHDALNNNVNDNNNDLHDHELLERNKKTRNREDTDSTEEHHRSNKQSANNNNNNASQSEPLELYDDFLLRSDSDKSKDKPRGKKKDTLIITNKEFVDLKSLLMQCAQAVANFDKRTVNDLMTRIRRHSSPQGDDAERVAHYFANAIDARLSGFGTTLHADCNYRGISLSDILKANKMLITACPFMTMSNLFAKQTVMKLAEGATTLHIVDFGILFGFQWPCLILALSERPGGPPKLRITGIDFPLPGFRPAEQVADTGRRIARYCERFGVPFEYNAIAQEWDTIRIEDLKIERDELLVVNSIYRLHCVIDGADRDKSPRDAVLDLIKKINPDMFIHGIVNGTHNTPFFVARFREAFFHYSAMFDMFEATVDREEDEDQKMRVAFERHVFGNGVMNVIACEGNDRIERPETYRQWEVRTRRAGFRQLSIDREIVRCVGKVKTDYHYHKEFLVDQDGEWIVLGWKGRVIHAISCWQPANR